MFKTDNKRYFQTYMLTRKQPTQPWSYKLHGTTQCFHHLIFPCLLKRMELALIMKTEKNFK